MGLLMEGKSKTRLVQAAAALATGISLTFLLNLDSYNVATPKQTTDACKLHYSHFHLIFTIPPLIILYFLASPFLTILDWHKLYILPVIATVWTTPFDSRLIQQEAWWYPTSCVLGRIAYVPLEEYAFFILQSLMTTLLTILITRWSTPRTCTKHALSWLLPLLPTSMVISGLYTLYRHEEGQHSLYYLSMIAWWASVPLTLLWWGTSQSWIGLVKNGQAKVWLWCLALPSIYLCCADIYALRRGTWHISEKKSLEFFVVPDLPIEEAIFFFATNLILVSACFAFDRVVWQRRAEDVAQSKEAGFAPFSPSYFKLNWATVQQIWRTFTRLEVGEEDDLQGTRIELQREHALQILARASKSFSTAATLLPWDLRVDLGCLYAFARAMDDFVDQPSQSLSTSSSKGNDASKAIDLLLLLVKIAFNDKQQFNQVIEEQLSEALNNHAESGYSISDQHRQDLLMSGLAASSLREIVPERLWNELIDGYQEDSTVDKPNFEVFEEQANYAQNVAGSIGEMCVRVVLARQGILVSKDYFVPKDIEMASLTSSKPQIDAPLGKSQIVVAPYARKVDLKLIERLLRDARRMGVSLQLVNIARDVVKDAVELKRCYLVTGGKDMADIRMALCGGQLERILSEGQGNRKSSSEEKNNEEIEVANLVSPTVTINSEIIFAQKLLLLNIADDIYRSSISTIDLLPSRPAATGLRVACAVYANIGSIIRRNGSEKALERSKAETSERLWTAIKAIYWY